MTEPATRAARLAQVGIALAALLIVALVALVNADVASRALLGRPLRGVAEMVAIAMPMTVFLALAWLHQSGGLIRADVLIRRLPRDTVVAVAATIDGLGALLAAVLAWAAWPWLARAWNDGEFLGVAGEFTVPSWPALAAVVGGALLLAWHAARAAIGSFATTIGRAPRALLATAVVATGLVALVGLPDTPATVGGSAVVVLLVLLAFGTPVAWALLASAGLGLAALKGSAVVAGKALGLAASGAVADYVFGVVPQFVLMGLIMGRADIGRDALLAAHALLRRVPGGLGIATVAANALFAAMTGISIASAAIFSKVAVPPLVEQGYTPRFAVGLVAGTSVLGMLIPPSLLLIVYGLVAEVSINALFLAAIVPGLLLTLAFAIFVVAVARGRPAFAVADLRADALPLLAPRTAVLRLLPLALLALTVLGGIYGGVFTPTEAGAVGSLLAAAIALVGRRLRLGDFAGLARECAATSAAILFLVVGAAAFGMMLTLSGIPAALGAWAAAAGLGLSGYALLYLAVLVALGFVLDSTSILLIVVPLALPTVTALGGDLVWFGLVTVVGVEVGLLTPPLGLSVYAIKSALDDQRITLGDIFAGAAPFAVLVLALAVALIVWPGLAGPWR
ncbi:MAG: TRAP transporter large permease subunit [Gammaproteobacteria bacterium]